MVEVLQALGQFEFVTYFRPEPIVPYLDRFGKSSFRKVVRMLLRNDRSWEPVDVLARTAGDALDDYLDFLTRLQILERREGAVRLTRPLDNMGPSLEHYVAQLCVRELRGSAEWGVTLERLPRAGGDYDVLAWLDPSLLYVECKSGLPSNIDESQIREFLQRSVELAPDLAILLVDTQDDLAGVVDGLINPILRGALGHKKETGPILPQTEYPRVSFGFRRFYVTNCNPSILVQLQRCLQHYYAHVKGTASWSDEPANFLNTPVRDES